jgi:hypothetical protein
MKRMPATFAKNQLCQVALPMRYGVAVGAYQEIADRFIQLMLVIGGTEGTSDCSSFCVTDVFGDLIAKGATTKPGQPLPQTIQVATRRYILTTERIHISKDVFINQRGKPVQLKQGVLHRGGCQQQLAAIFGGPAQPLPNLVALTVGVAELVRFVNDYQSSIESPSAHPESCWHS